LFNSVHLRSFCTICVRCGNAKTISRVPGLILLLAMPARAQVAPSIARVDSAYIAGNPTAALSMCDSLLARDSTDFDVLWRASRAALALGILDPRPTNDYPMYLRAESLARTAARLRPERIEGHYWLAAAMGRRALHSDFRTTARLAKAVDESANRALAIDSMHAGANDVIGKLNSEVSNLSPMVRFVAGHFLGVSVARHTSWALAEHYLRRAVGQDSTMILYRLDLGQLYVRRHQWADAERVLRDVATMPRVHPPDEVFRSEALALLAKTNASLHH
jgi:hypothetical protein